MSSQWHVTLSDLPRQGQRWRGAVTAALLAESHAVEGLADLASDPEVRLLLARRGEVYHLSGDWRAAAERTCCRCNERFGWAFSGRVARDFRLGDSPRGDESGVDVLPWPGRLDLLDVLREEMWLAWEQHVLCRPDCRGLCAACGHNLNEGACGCARVDEDHPFAVLRQLKL